MRLQTQPKVGPGETPLFKGTLDCAMKTVRNEVLPIVYNVCVLVYDVFRVLVDSTKEWLLHC